MALDPLRAVANAGGAIPLPPAKVRGLSLRRTAPRARLSPLQAILSDPRLSDTARALIEKTRNDDGSRQPGRSILGQISDTVTGAPKGLVHFAANTVKTAIGPARATIDLFKGDLDPHTFRQLTSPDVILHGGTDEQKALLHKYEPLTEELQQSVSQTAGRLAQLGPVEVRSVGGNKIQTYGDLARSPNGLVGGILNDVGNVALAGGAVSKVAGAGAVAADAAGATRTASALGKVAARAEGVAKLGGEVANAPFKPFGMAARAGRSYLGRVLERTPFNDLAQVTDVANPYDSVLRRAGQESKALAEETLRRISDKPGREGMAARGSMFLTDTGKRLKAAMRDSRVNPARFGRYETSRLVKLSGVAEKGGAPSLVEQEAAAAILNGVGRADYEASKLVGADTSLSAHAGGTEHDIRPGHTVTTDGQKLVHAYYEGTLPAEQVARIQAVMQAESEAVGRATASALAGHGSINGPLDPAYLGDAPLDAAVHQHLRDAGMSDKDLGALNDLRFSQDPMGTPLTWDQLADQFDGTPEGAMLQEVLLDPQVYPTAWREAMHVTGSVADATGEFMLPRTPQEMLDAGWERPAYLPSPEIRTIAERKVWNTPDVATTEGFGSGLRGIGNERHRETLGTGPYSLATFAEALNRGIRQREFNNSLLEFVMADETKTVRDILNDDPVLQGPDLNDLDRQVIEDFKANPPIDPDMPPIDVNDPLEQLRHLADVHVAKRDPFDQMDARTKASKAKEEFGRLLHGEVVGRKHDILPGDRAAPKVGDFEMGADVVAKHVNPESVVLPAGLKERAIRYSTGKNRNDLISGLDWAHSKLKGQVLAYSTRWQIGDAIGVQLMSWVGGGVNPGRLISAMNDLRKMTPEARDAAFNHPEFVESGIRHQDIGQHFDPSVVAKPLRFGRGLVKSKGFRLNQWINSSGRHAFVLAKVDRVLKEHGLDISDASVGDPAAWQDPQVKGAIDTAVNDANKVFGTIDDLTPVEQRVVKNIAWFWPWTRHITTLAMRTAVDNPARILWTLRLGALGSDPNSTLPEFLRGALKGPGGYWSPNFLNPINDVGTGNLLSPDAALRQLSPVYKLGIGALFNRDANRSLNVFSHAPGTSPNRLASALYQGLKVSPLTRSAMDLAPTGQVGSIGFGPHKRYGSGQIIRDPNTHQPSTTTSRWRALAIGMPLPTPAGDVAGSQSSVAKAKRLTLARAGGANRKPLKLRR